MQRSMAIVAILLLCQLAARAQFLTQPAPVAASAKRATVSAHLNFNALQPGQQAVVAVVLDIQPGLHAQSHTPTAPNYIKLEVKLDSNDAIQFHEPIYPPGENKDYPALGKLNVYEGKAIVYVPMEMKKDAKPGTLKLSGQIVYQLCDDKACFRPERPTWSIETRIVPAGEKVEPASPEIFKSFDPAWFARTGTRATSEAPREKVELFGRELGDDAYIFAFLGALVIGMIFNVMPCVLPVVPLKAIGFYEVSQHNRAKSIALGAVFSAGLIATFGILAVVVIVMKALAWGELFANPWFAGAIVLILVLMALGTFGAFNVGLPTAVYRWSPRHDTYLGNFLFGILTAILSTPCTFGMFLGLLVWAARQPAAIGTALVMTVGVGMALPYFLLSALPEVARRFPRTGPWAEIVKQMMGFLLLATAVYFAKRFIGDWLGKQGFWWTLFAVIAVSGIFLVARTLHFTKRAGPVITAVVIALLIVGPALAVTLKLTYVPIEWTPYSASALQQARASGRPVMIDFTADWCGNCIALEATVLTDKRVVDIVKEQNILPLRADLTRDDATGWELLKQIHPVGAIPLTAVYLPKAANPKTLAGLYSTQDLLNALATERPVASAR